MALDPTRNAQVVGDEARMQPGERCSAARGVVLREHELEARILHLRDRPAPDLPSLHGPHGTRNGAPTNTSFRRCSRRGRLIIPAWTGTNRW